MTASEQSASYDALVDRYQAIIALRRRVESEMLRCTPGSMRGAELYCKLVRIESAESAARRAVRSHHDAPVAG